MGARRLVSLVPSLSEARGAAFAEPERALVAGCGLPRPAWPAEAAEVWRAVRPAALVGGRHPTGG
ncbi:hypothetical protein [Streptomyces radicis]|uniref:Uncharacterized protein n=1 Tax=Streptomyces radicis TaxID=1750517 RepID=A0A3A9WKD9_9ACTN|nr:hypothetical protein [Streptomyces radicis]RKN12753.1 hypothetical protein D7319_02090 [Streptomyces radicis]RKN27484.1 hypothetical protein D7318_00805 [Streptomyces radicis]